MRSATISTIFIVLVVSSLFADTRNNLLALTHNLRTKMVWVQDSSLVCFVTDEDTTRVMLEKGFLTMLAYPLITPDGRTVIFASKTDKICKLDWTDSHKKIGVELCAGICPEASWRDPANGTIWIYYSKAYGSDKRFSYFHRFRLDNAAIDELVWDKTNADVPFSLSADGKYGACQLPWPKTGIAAITYNPDGSIVPNGAYYYTTKSGCNSNILPDNSYRMFHVNLGTITWNDTNYANHHGVYMYDSLLYGKTDPKYYVKLSCGTKPFTRIRITNHPRYFTYYGPEGEIQEVYLGRFKNDYSIIEDTVRLTFSSKVDDGGPYAWIQYTGMKLSKDSLLFICPFAASNPPPSPVIVSCVDTNDMLPELAATSNRTWLTVTLEKIGNTVTLQNNIDISILARGLYSAEVTVQGSGMPSVSYPVTVKIIGYDSIIDTIVIIPPEPAIRQGDSLRFVALCFDTYGSILNVPLQWTTRGGGTIDSSGSFKSSGMQGTFTIRARLVADTSFAATATIRVLDSTGFRLDPLDLVFPNGGETFFSNDTIVVSWNGCKNQCSGALVDLSIDSGITWTQINNGQGMSVTDALWGHYSWPVSAGTIAAISATQSHLSNACLVRVVDYLDHDIVDLSDSFFTIKAEPRVSVLHPARPDNYAGVMVTRSPAAVHVTADFAQRSYSLDVFDIRGKRLFSKNAIGVQTFVLSGIVGKGMVLFRIADDRGRIIWKHFYCFF